jgi:ABC-type nickel/cobalt efflux system permease component RcnA
LIFAFVALASAHPLGNFSINQFSRIEVEKSQVKLRSVLDIAEIPTFQESQKIDTNKDGALSQAELDAYVETVSPDYVANLQVSVDNQTIELRPAKKNISLRNGSGNLPTLRIEWDLVGDLLTSGVNVVHQFKFENKNYPERIGWDEIVVERGSGVNVFNSTAFGSGITNELNVYPQDLSVPLREKTAEFSFTASAIPQDAKPLQNRDGQITTPVEKDRFAELINGEITTSIVLLGLLLAFGLGAAHALSPGHGKTVVGAYLVGSRGTFKHAVFLGLTVTITHTLGVFALGLLTLFASNYILPETLMPYLNFLSGLLVFFIGLTLFKDRLFTALGWKTNNHYGHEEAAHSLDEHDFQSLEDAIEYNSTPDAVTHTHGGSTHTHLPPKEVTWRSLLGLGISGGLLPCPSALVLMLSAISLNRIGYGIVLTLIFSLGLATTLTTVGLAFLYVGKLFDNPTMNNNRIFKTLPVLSAFVIACVGAFICYSSLF